MESRRTKYLALELLLVLLLALVYTTCHAQTKQAQIDTVYCSLSSIKNYVAIKTETGKTRTYAVYKSAEIEELIPVSNSVIEYIKLCESNGIKPSLGIRIRNGQITSIVKFKKRITKQP